jgi:hypothetical protein
MSDKSTKAIFLEYFRSQSLLHYVRNFLPLPFLRVGKKRLTRTKVEPLIKSIRSRAKDLSFPKPLFEKFLQMTIDGFIAGTEPKALENFVRSHYEGLERKIRHIPNTLDKAYDALRAFIEVEDFKGDQAYDAMVLLHDEVSAELTAKEVRSWKEEAKIHKERGDYHLLGSDIFWTSADFHETIDGISRYRFREHFGIGEFELAFAEVESMLATSLLEGSSGMEAITIPFWGDQKLTSVAYDLWLVSRSRNLPNRIRDFVNIALRRIAVWQSSEGWWSDFQLTEPAGKDSKTGLKTSRYLPNTYTTALCSLNLLKLSISEPLREKGILGAKWLIERQNPDGSWSREHISKNRIISKPDVFLSLLALEALTRSGICNIKHSIESGLEWITKQQNELGMWNDEGFPFPFTTVLVLEFIKLKDTFSSELDQYLSISKSFLNRSMQFSLEENSNSHRLAIITAYQGIQAFLYSVLSHPSINIKIFKTAKETIGMREALTRFQTYLQEQGEMKRNEVISYRNSLDRLAYLRDQVEHKGIDITQSMCRPLVDDALRFASKYSLKIFGFDVLI